MAGRQGGVIKLGLEVREATGAASSRTPPRGRWELQATRLLRECESVENPRLHARPQDEFGARVPRRRRAEGKTSTLRPVRTASLLSKDLCPDVNRPLTRWPWDVGLLRGVRPGGGVPSLSPYLPSRMAMIVAAPTARIAPVAVRRSTVWGALLSRRLALRFKMQAPRTAVAPAAAAAIPRPREEPSMSPLWWVRVVAHARQTKKSETTTARKVRLQSSVVRSGCRPGSLVVTGRGG